MSKKSKKSVRPHIVLGAKPIAKATHNAVSVLAAQMREERRMRVKPMTRLEFDGSASGADKIKEVES